MDPAIIAGGLNVLGSVFGRKKTMTPGQSIESTARGVTTAGKKWGINRLTLLGASNATAGAGMEMGSPPPLASLSVLGAVIEDNYGKDATDRREHNRLQNELLTLEVQRARTLATTPVAASLAGGGAVTGGRTQTRTTGPASGYLTEADRNPTVADERDNTVSYQSHGQQSVVPVGPDFDEVMTGIFIEANNKRKARLAREARSPGMTSGAMLAIPEGPSSQGTRSLLPLPSRTPDGKTGDGRPFWTMPDGSIRYGNSPKN